MRRNTILLEIMGSHKRTNNLYLFALDLLYSSRSTPVALSHSCGRSTSFLQHQKGLAGISSDFLVRKTRPPNKYIEFLFTMPRGENLDSLHCPKTQFLSWSYAYPMYSTNMVLPNT